MTVVFKGKHMSHLNIILKSSKGCEKHDKKQRFRDRLTICNWVSLSQNCGIMAAYIGVLDLLLE